MKQEERGVTLTVAWEDFVEVGGLGLVREVRYSRGDGLSLPVRHLNRNNVERTRPSEREIDGKQTMYNTRRSRTCYCQGWKAITYGTVSARGFCPYCGSDRVTFRAIPSLGARPAHIFPLDFLRTGT